VTDNKKHIYVFSPSGAVRDKAAFRRGVKRLQQLGHEVQVDEAALASHTRFAGDDATRLAAIGRAAASGADVALMARGGYGLTRILPDVPFKKIAKSIDRGMLWVGFSDFTALQCGLLAHSGHTTWAGPGLCEGFGPKGGPDDIMEACFDDLLSGQGEGTGWRQHPLPQPATGEGGAKPAKVWQRFEAHDATLWGGNLTVLASLLGTPYFPQVQGGVLFLEDVGEHPYRLERMLTQLLYAGVLSRQRAILLGQFNDFALTPHDKGYKLATVVDWLRRQLKIPVFTNLPFGHVPTKVLLPVGAKVDMAVDGRDAMLVWGHHHDTDGDGHHQHQ
jgi:muramoyltetrapeptide carboxypeptidase